MSLAFDGQDFVLNSRDVKERPKTILLCFSFDRIMTCLSFRVLTHVKRIFSIFSSALTKIVEPTITRSF